MRLINQSTACSLHTHCVESDHPVGIWWLGGVLHETAEVLFDSMPWTVMADVDIKDISAEKTLYLFFDMFCGISYLYNRCVWCLG